jgi:hypothetical protein
MRVIRTRIIGPASSPSQRIEEASRREPRFAMVRELVECGLHSQFGYDGNGATDEPAQVLG